MWFIHNLYIFSFVFIIYAHIHITALVNIYNFSVFLPINHYIAFTFTYYIINYYRYILFFMLTLYANIKFQ